MQQTLWALTSLTPQPGSCSWLCAAGPGLQTACLLVGLIPGSGEPGAGKEEGEETPYFLFGDCSCRCSWGSGILSRPGGSSGPSAVPFNPRVPEPASWPPWWR